MLFFKKETLLSFLIFPFLLLALSTGSAQDFVLIDEGFEKEEISWMIHKGVVKEGISYRGNKSLGIASMGKAYFVLNVPEDAEEVIVKGWMKVISSEEAEEILEESAPINLEDTLILSPVVLIPQASIGVEAFSDTLMKGSSSVLNVNAASYLKITSGWMSFEQEIKIPRGAKKIRISCSNSLEKTIACFDEIVVEKRQLGLVKSESEWAKSVREFNEKASRLIKNGDFEDGAQVWDPYWGFELSDVAHSGKYSCMIQNKDSGAWRGTSNLIPYRIPEGATRLKISVWIKADNVVGGPNPWETGAILLALKDDNGNEIAGGDAVARTVGTHDWKKFETYFTISTRATRFNILLQLGASTGKIYFDDIFAEAMTDEEFYLANLKIKNPGFENSLNGWPAYAGVVSDEQAHSGKYSLKVSGNVSAWEMRYQSVSLQRGKKEVTVSGWMKTINVSQSWNQWEGARIYVEFKDENGLSFGDGIPIGRVVGDTDWKFYSKTISIPEDATEMVIYCGRANVTGAVYFDDISVDYSN